MKLYLNDFKCRNRKLIQFYNLLYFSKKIVWNIFFCFGLLLYVQHFQLNKLRLIRSPFFPFLRFKSQVILQKEVCVRVREMKGNTSGLTIEKWFYSPNEFDDSPLHLCRGCCCLKNWFVTIASGNSMCSPKYMQFSVVWYSTSGDLKHIYSNLQGQSVICNILKVSLFDFISIISTTIASCYSLQMVYRIFAIFRCLILFI